MSRSVCSVLVLFVLSLLVVVVLVDAVKPAKDASNNGKANAPGQLKKLAVKVKKNYAKNLKPFNGRGHKLRVPRDPVTGRVHTGTRGRPAAWLAAVQQIFINESQVQVWESRPLPAAIQAVVSSGLVTGDASQSTSNVTATAAAAFRASMMEHVPVPARVTVQRRRVSEHVFEQQVQVQSSTVTSNCGLNASLIFTPDNTTFALLFSNLNAVTSGSIIQQSRNCAFRVPITMPTGIAVAALAAQLRGFAQSSPGGVASIAWSAMIGVDFLASLSDLEWAELVDASNYEARYWSGGEISGADFDPINIDFGELDTVSPTFSPCGAPETAPAGLFTVPVDFHFTVNAVRSSSELSGPQKAQSSLYLDSLDGSRDVSLVTPFDFELC